MGYFDKFKKKKPPQDSDKELFEKAEKIVHDFSDIIATQNAPLINENVLPHSKQTIKTAFKLLIAYANEIKDEEYKSLLINLYFLLPQFQKFTEEEEKILIPYCASISEIAVGNFSKEQVKEKAAQYATQYAEDIIKGMELQASFKPLLEKEKKALDEELAEILNAEFNNLLKT